MSQMCTHKKNRNMFRWRSLSVPTTERRVNERCSFISSRSLFSAPAQMPIFNAHGWPAQHQPKVSLISARGLAEDRVSWCSGFKGNAGMFSSDLYLQELSSGKWRLTLRSHEAAAQRAVPMLMMSSVRQNCKLESQLLSVVVNTLLRSITSLTLISSQPLLLQSTSHRFIKRILTVNVSCL